LASAVSMMLNNAAPRRLPENKQFLRASTKGQPRGGSGPAHAGRFPTAYPVRRPAGLRSPCPLPLAGHFKCRIRRHSSLDFIARVPLRVPPRDTPHAPLRVVLFPGTRKLEGSPPPSDRMPPVTYRKTFVRILRERRLTHAAVMLLESCRLNSSSVSWNRNLIIGNHRNDPALKES
jgi:hypothetical protein